MTLVTVAIITSWRCENSQKTNEDNFEELKNYIKNLGLPFRVVRGHWKECINPNKSYKDCTEKDLVDSDEPALFIPGITKEDAIYLGNVYQQDAVVYTGPDTCGNVVLIYKDGSEENVGKLDTRSIGIAYKELLKTKHSQGFQFYCENVKSGHKHLEALIEMELQKKL